MWALQAENASRTQLHDAHKAFERLVDEVMPDRRAHEQEGGFGQSCDDLDQDALEFLDGVNLRQLTCDEACGTVGGCVRGGQ